MSKPKVQIQWIVKDKGEKIHGPYSTQRILKGIQRGEFTGTEQVARYPGGSWIPISENPTFYDQLLASLQEVIDIPMPKRREKATQREETRKGDKEGNKGKDWNENQDKDQGAFSSEKKSKESPRDVGASQGKGTGKGKLQKKGSSDFAPFPSYPKQEEAEGVPPHSRASGPLGSGSSASSEPLGSSFQGPSQDSPFPSPKGGWPQGLQDSSSPLNISLKRSKEVKQRMRQQQRRRFFMVMSLMLVGMFCLAVWVQDPFGNKKSPRFHLLRPRKGQKQIGSEEEKRKFLQALQLFQRDEVQSYINAQDILVQLVERSPRHLESKGILCITYSLLWPFAHRDSQDLKTVGFVARLAKRENPTDVYSVLCDLIHLMLRGRWEKAHNLLHQALNNYQESAILYQIKGQILMNEKNYNTALTYTEQSLQIWPKWAYTHLQRAQILQSLNKNKEALGVYRAVLKKYPEHLKAKVLLGRLYYTFFKDTSKAIPLLQTAVQSKKPFPPLLRASALAILAEYFMEQGQPKRALKLAKDSFRINSRNEKVRKLISQLGGKEVLIKSKEAGSIFVMVADQFMRSGNYLAAYAELKAALDNNPKDTVAAIKLTKCLWKLHRPQKALFYLNQALKHKPDSVDAYILQADYLSQQFQYGAAQRALKRAQRIEKKNHLVYYGYALVSYRQHDLKATLQFVQLALKIYSLDTKSLVLMGKVLFEMEKLEESLHPILKAIELDFTMEEAQSMYIKILAKLQGKDSAISYVRNLMKDYPYEGNYYISLAEIHQEEQRYKDALSLYQTVNNISAKNKKALIGMGNTYKSLGKPDQAIQSYLSAALLDPSDAKPILLAGLLYMEHGHYNEAIRQFERVVQINAKYPRVYYYMGKSYLSVGQLNKALISARKENEYNPNLPDPHLLAAQVYTLQKQYKACLSEYQKAIRFQEQGAVVYVKMAHCHRLSGNLEAAEDLLKVAEGKESALPEIYQERGTLYQMRKEHCSATENYQRYLQLKPTAKDYGEIQNRIGRMKRENPLEFQSCP